MRIEELVIDGFKSYSGRTRITGWDASFNAITGLNGSGKSNILDAICFVLGITNMATMRAQNQVDLIYKRGTAGVTKASVTIVFDNSDPDKSPDGFKDSKTITVTRTIAMPNISKYLLNGHKSSQQKIQILFQSVQLNINNPNFVIMQGKITKVLNMKPPEILSLVEEAAGTRMFESQKERAKSQMDKKQRKVDELISTLDEEVKPKLDKQRKQRAEFLEFQKASIELERMGHLLLAHEWVDANNHLGAKENEKGVIQTEIKVTEEGIKQHKQQIKTAKKAVKEVEKQRDDEAAKGGKVVQLKKDAADSAKEVGRLAAQVELKAKDIKEEQDAIATLEGDTQNQSELLKVKSQEIQKREEAAGKVGKVHNEMQQKLEANEELLQTLLTGVSNTKANQAGGGGGFLGALQTAQKRETDGASEERQAQNRLSMSRKELDDLNVKLKAAHGETKDNRAKLDQMRREVEGIRSQVVATGWSAEKEDSLNNESQTARTMLRNASDRQEKLKHALGKADFQYNAPRNFDTSKVKGTTARLMHITEENYGKTTALEVAAGGRLYHVVVEDDNASSRILKECTLRNRVTLIPLNKIQTRVLNDLEVNKCRALAKGGKFWPAIQLVKSSPDVSKAMQYVFSNTMVCEDAATANIITYQANLRSVTVQGDLYDTGGTLSGGAPPTGSGLLLKVQEVLKVEEEVHVATERLRVAEGELAKNEGRRNKWRSLNQQLQMKTHALGLLEQQVGGSNASRLEAQIEETQGQIQNLNDEVAEAKRKQEEAKADVKKLKKDMDEFKNDKEGKIEQLRSTIAKQRSDLQKHQVAVTTNKKELQASNLEKDEMEADIQRLHEDVAKTQRNIRKFTSELEKLKEQHETAQQQHAETEAELQEELAVLGRFDEELKQLQNAIASDNSRIAELEREIDKKTHKLGSLDKEATQLEHRLANLQQLHPWIAEDSHEFGKAGGKYDFSGHNWDEVRKRVEDLEKSQAGKKKKVNPRVIAELESLEKQEKKLSDQLNQVLIDKEKIESTINELDGYKREALSKTWTKVSTDFGGIFRDLLPGNFAKLEQIEASNLMAGLEVKVQLGSVWKQSLTELSGGQRSLIALSLIMALLQFKPAPMYILDEIDAALDLSHTQHIGHLFRTRFKGSQFIVVSLKEGLFTNANVLFRAKFRDGTSVVERTAARSTSTLYNPST